MSSTDERIVQMRFDNKQFERNAQESMTTLERLKKGLNLEGSAKGLDRLTKAGANFTLDGIARAVDGLANRFSTMGIAGMTAINNLTNSAINAGKRIVSALTVDPIKSGLDEYETKMNAIKTILANTKGKGTNLDDVNKALAELNDYADKTIYNFGQMTDMVGKFAAKTGELDSSVSIVKGLANLAAASGVDNIRLQGALYQVSQMSETVKSLDWMSLDTAGLSTVKFKDDLIAMAKAMGTIDTKTLTKLNSGAVNFRDTLSGGWLTKNVFESVTAMYAADDAMTALAGEVTTVTKLFGVMKEVVGSGWATSWENIIGNQAQATALLTGLSNAFGAATNASADARNAILAFWNANGGRQALLQGIGYALLSISKVLQPLEDAFKAVFKPITGDKLIKISEAFRDLMKGFQIGEGTSKNLKRTFQGLFAVLDLGGKAFAFIAKCIGLVVKALAPGAGGLLSVTANLGDFLVSLNDTAEKSNFFGVALEKVAKVMSAVKYAVTNIKDTLLSFGSACVTAISNSELLSNALSGIKAVFMIVSDKIRDISNALSGDKSLPRTGTKVDKVNTAFETLRRTMSKIKDIFVKVATTIKSIVGPVFEWLKKSLSGLTLQDVGALLTGGGLIMIAKTINDGIGSISGILEQLGNTLKAFQLKVKAEALLKIAIAVGILTAALFVLSFLDIAKIAKGLGALTIILVELVVALKVLDKVKGEGKIAGKLLAIGAALLVLAVAVKILSSIDWQKLGTGVTALGFIMSYLIIFIKATSSSDITKSAKGLIGFSIAINILVGALAILGNLDPVKLDQGSQALFTLIGVITLFTMLTTGNDVKKSAGGMVGFGIGLTILVGALAILGNLDPLKLKQGADALYSLIGVLTLFTMLTTGNDVKKSAGGMVGFGIGLTILVGALAILGNLDPTKLDQGVKAIATLVAGLTVFTVFTNGSDLAKSAGGMIGFGIGIGILVVAISKLSELDPTKLDQGIKAIATLIGGLTLFIVFTNGGDLAASAAGLIGFSVGIAILAGAVALLAQLPFDKALTGIGVIATLITVIGVFVNVTSGGDLKKSAAGIIGFAVGIMMLAGVIAVLSALNSEKLILATVAISTLIAVMATFVKVTQGGGLLTGVAGMIGFAAAIGILAMALIPLAQLDTTQLLGASAAIAILMLSFAAFTKLVEPASLMGVAAGLLVMAGGIMILSVALSILGALNFVTLITGFAALAATFIILGVAAGALTLLVPVILGLAAAIALLGIGMLSIGAGFALFGAGITSIAALGPNFKTVMMSIINLIPVIAAKLGEGIITFAKAIQNGIPQLVIAATAIATGLIKVFVDLIPKVVQAIAFMLLSVLQTIAKNILPITDAGMKIILGFLKGIANNIQKVVEMAYTIIVNLLKGITNKLPGVIAAGVDLMVAFMKGIGKETPRLIAAGYQMIIDFINGLADTVVEKLPLLVDAFKNLGHAIITAICDVLGINSPSTVFAELGSNIIDGLVNGIKNNAIKALNGIKTLGGSLIDKVKDVLGIHSPSKVFNSIGSFLIDGFTGGITENGDKTVKAAETVATNAGKASTKAVKKSNAAVKSAYDTAVEWIDERKYYNNLSLKEELAKWQEVQQKYKVGSEERKKIDREVYRVKNEILKDGFDKETKRIDDLKYYKKLSLEQELAKWQDIQKKKNLTAEETEKADKEVYRLKQELYKDDYDKAVESIDNKKYYNKLSLAEELKEWQDIQKKKNLTAEETEKADKEVYRLKQELYKDDYDKAVESIDNKKYHNQESLKQELADWEAIQKKKNLTIAETEKAEREVYRIKQELNAIDLDYTQRIADLESARNETRKQAEDDYYAKVKEINGKLVQDIQSVNKEYEDALKSRTDSLYAAYGLFDKVDPSKAISGDELITNLKSQVNAFDSWQKNIGDLTKKGIDEGLLKELTDMGPKSADQITALNGMSEEQLTTYVSLWKTKHSEAKTEAIGELESLRLQTIAKIAQLNADTSMQLSTLYTNWQINLLAINTEASNQLTALQNEWFTKINGIKTNTETQVTAMTDNVKTSVSDMKTGMEKDFTALTENIQTIMKTPDWYGLGASIIAGMAQGIKDKANSLVEEMEDAAQDALQAAKDTLGIKSPSKEFAKVGMYADEGLAAGLRSFAGVVVSSAKEVGESAIFALRSAISNISNIIESGVDVSPVIRPVLDLSNIEAGGQWIDNMFSQKQGLSVASINAKLPVIGQITKSTDVANPESTKATQGNVSFVQNNYSPKALSRIDIYRQTKNQISAMKGLPV